MVHLDRQRFEEAQHNLELALQQAQEIDYLEGQAKTHNNLGYLFSHLQQYAQAETHL